MTFTDAASVVKVLQAGEHVLDNKKVDPKQATVKNETPVSVCFYGLCITEWIIF